MDSYEVFSRRTMVELGKDYIKHTSETVTAEQIHGSGQIATTDFPCLQEMEGMLICIPTPLNARREPDLSIVCDTAESTPHVRRGQLVVLKRATYPGPTEEARLPILKKSGPPCPVVTYLTEGHEIPSSDEPEADFLVAFSPKREDSGNKQFKPYHVPRIIEEVDSSSA
ncbi:MAG: hypothetical protein WAO35_25395 [Terriglobia bacterium]